MRIGVVGDGSVTMAGVLATTRVGGFTAFGLARAGVFERGRDFGGGRSGRGLGVGVVRVRARAGVVRRGGGGVGGRPALTAFESAAVIGGRGRRRIRRTRRVRLRLGHHRGAGVDQPRDAAGQRQAAEPGVSASSECRG